MSASNKNCNDGASKSSYDGVCEVNDMLQNMKTVDEEENNVPPKCANCGKESSDVTNTCNKCKSVMYCNAACKKKHRHKHKKDCEEHQRLAAERAAELHDEKLFKEPLQQEEDCPICFLRMPSLTSGSKYKTCCGKVICSGCIHAVNMMTKDSLCAFCRSPEETEAVEEEIIERTKKRVEFGNLTAMTSLGTYYANGMHGLPQDYTKALELWHRAAELGTAGAYGCIGLTYYKGYGVEMDKTKAHHYFELAAMGGNVIARHYLGFEEEVEGNMSRALKHYTIAVKSGYVNSLKRIQKLYLNGHATKEDYTKALRAYHSYLNEIKSVQRDEAAAYDDDYKYID